jgi:hypothetical protein
MQKKLLISLLVLAIVGGLAAAYIFKRSAASQDVVSRRPIAVMIDNLAPDARPQTGLDTASMVFETLVEGGITRFMAVYTNQDAATVGPVRSTRLYYNHWAAGLGAILGHDGGNVDALQELPKLTTVYNEDADRISGPFWRTTDRLAPHNEYTSTDRLRNFAQAHGADVESVAHSYPVKNDAPTGKRPARFALHIQFSYADYNVDWQFDPATDTYLRSMGGQPHVDAITGKQLAANTVVVMYTDETPATDPFTPGAIHLRTEGTGQAVVYEDGTSIAGTWSKPNIDSPVQWLDRQGHEIALNRGVTWVEVVPKGNQVTTG